jgi:hypothetical protein
MFVVLRSMSLLLASVPLSISGTSGVCLGGQLPVIAC